jgi:hypothetical protein
MLIEKYSSKNVLLFILYLNSKIAVDYITKSKLLRMQMALNGFDFFNNENLIVVSKC